MTVPLIILAALSVVGGFVGVPASLGGGNAIEHFLEPLFVPANDKMALHSPHGGTLEYVLMAVSVVIALGGIVFAWRWYAVPSRVPATLAGRFAGLYRLLVNKWFVDEFYEAAFVTPTVKGSERLLWKGVDIRLIDGAVNAAGKIVKWFADTARVVQTGVAPTYVFVFVVGVIMILGWMLR
jgi:NADH-quinone oxidoreductase subunit L